MRSSATSPHSTLGLLKFAEIFAISQVTGGGGN